MISKVHMDAIVDLDDFSLGILVGFARLALIRLERDELEELRKEALSITSMLDDDLTPRLEEDE